MSEKIPPQIKCVICGRVFAAAHQNSDGFLEYFDVTSHSDLVHLRVFPHKCPTKSSDMNVTLEE